MVTEALAGAVAASTTGVWASAKGVSGTNEPACTAAASMVTKGPTLDTVGALAVAVVVMGVAPSAHGVAGSAATTGAMKPAMRAANMSAVPASVPSAPPVSLVVPGAAAGTASEGMFKR